MGGEDLDQIKLENSPTLLATVMKDPNIKGIIDPDSDGNIKNKKGFDTKKVEKLNEAIKRYQEKIIEILRKEMKEGEPFLHTVISEGRKERITEDGKPIIIIAGGMRKGQLPADPRVLRWFAEQLQSKLGTDNVGIKVKINKEGEPLCGTVVHTDRRKMLEDLYQFIKVKVPTRLLKDKIIINKVAEVLAEFSKEYPDQESFNDFLEINTIPEDKIRLEGKMYFGKGLSITDEIEDNEIAMSSSLRRAFKDVEIRDRVAIYNVNDPGNKIVLTATKARTKNTDGSNRPKTEKVGWRIPAISQKTVDKLKLNQQIVIEKFE